MKSTVIGLEVGDDLNCSYCEKEIKQETFVAVLARHNEENLLTINFFCHPKCHILYFLLSLCVITTEIKMIDSSWILVIKQLINQLEKHENHPDFDSEH